MVSHGTPYGGDFYLHDATERVHRGGLKLITALCDVKCPEDITGRLAHDGQYAGAFRERCFLGTRRNVGLDTLPGQHLLDPEQMICIADGDTSVPAVRVHDIRDAL